MCARRDMTPRPFLSRRAPIYADIPDEKWNDWHWQLSHRLNSVEDFEKVFKEVDILLTPTAPHPAFKIGEQSNSPLAMYLEDIYVSAASLAGLPAISIPAGLVNRMPVGAQLIAPRLKEDLILKIAEFILKK